MKSNKKIIASVLLLVWLLAADKVVAHSPLKPDDNESLEKATVVVNPTKSWAIYAELHEGVEAQYYRLNLKQAERLRAMLFIPLEEKGFAPSLVIMGPGIASRDDLPEYVEVPDGAGVKVMKANVSVQPGYEPFTPSSYYYLASSDLEVTAPGTYYLSVYEASRGGRYGLAVGYLEEYGVDEWILIPISVIGIRQWEGQSLLLMLAPMLATLVIGFFALIWKARIALQARRLTGSIAGFLYIGSGVTTLTQMLIAVSASGLDLSAIVTVLFILLSILLGLAILWLTVRTQRVTLRTRTYLVLLGVSGLVAWSGLILGPILAVLAGLLLTSGGS